MILRAGFGYDTEEASLEAGLSCPEDTLTQQHDKDEADINVLVRRFGVTGELPQVTVTPVYSDFVDTVNDYHSAMNLIIQADRSFMELPADVRVRFENDPGVFVDFVSDPANIEAIRELGLASPKVEVPPSADEGHN
jgi:phage internal scaffolding protein